MYRLRQIKDFDTKLLILVSSLAGAVWFLFIYGVDVINVTNDTWILGANGDITQHYLGWRFYRESGWHLMFGLIDGITDPYPLSIIYMDSIPLFAVFFKILSPILPETFQYLGLYGFISFILQSCIGALLMDRLTHNKVLSVLFGYLTLTYPAIYQRMFDHTALAGHWIILLGIYVWCTKKEDAGFKSESIRWGITLSLAVFLHAYYIPMIAVMMICSLLEDGLNGKWKQAVCSGIVSIMAALLCMFLLGAFYGNSGISDAGLGSYSLNLNGFYNSQYIGRLFKSWPNYSAGQAEGLAYLGAGCLAAVILAFIILVVTFRKSFTRRKKIMLLYMVLMTVLALSPVISFNEHTVFIINYPGFVYNILSIFRASGRFAWPVAYMAVTGAFVILARCLKKRIMICLTVVLIGIQLFDIYHYMDYRSDEVTLRRADSVLQSPVWDEIAGNYDKIVFITYGGEYDDKMLNEYLGVKTVFNIMDYAAEHDMVLNDGYVSRRDVNAINETKMMHWENLLNGNPDKDTLYVFYDIPWEVMDCLHLYYIDEILVGSAEPLNGVEEFSMQEGMNLLHAGLNFTECNETSEGRYIKTGGESFGPYFTLEPGTYRIIVLGNGLEQMEYDICYNCGEDFLEPMVDYVGNDRLEYTVSVGETVRNLEVRFRNEEEDWILVESATIYKTE